MALLDLAPRSFEEYAAGGGGDGLRIALGAWPEAVIEEVARSGLRGRGGAGFPTGEKWRAVRSAGAGPRFAVCNAAEGEPATFKDRTLLRTNPYQVLEGLAIAAYAVGAERAYIWSKEAFAPETEALERALKEMQAARMRSGRSRSRWSSGPTLPLRRGDGARGGHRGAPPLPRIAGRTSGLFAQPPNDNPTLVNNVETLANVAAHPRARAPTGSAPTAPTTRLARWCSRSAATCGGRACSSCRSAPRCARSWRSAQAGHRGSKHQGDIPRRVEHRPGARASSTRRWTSTRCARSDRAWARRVRRVRRFGVHGAGGLPLLAVPGRGIVRAMPACKFGTGEATEALAALESGERFGSGYRARPRALPELNRRTEMRAPHR